jgi:GNAT superfamily N-acetyltransferase
MEDPVRIRPARASDRRCLLQLWQGLIEHHRGLAPKLPGLDPKPDALRTEIDRGLASPACKVFVAEAGDRAVGFLFCEIDSSGRASAEGGGVGSLHEMYIRPSWRRRGVARALVRVALEWLQELGVKRISVRIEAANPEALGFWRRQGFEDRARVLERTL